MKEAGSSLSGRPAWVVFPELEPATPRDQARTSSVQSREATAVVARPDRTAADRSVKWAALSFRNIHEHGDLLVRYLEARHSIFIDRLHWRVNGAEGLEFDQYDTPFCRWVVLHEFGKILGGVRLLPTTATCGIYSYMLRDAQKGILADIPTDVLFFEAPVDRSIWEATRFFVTDDVPAARRLAIHRILFERMVETARDNGASSLLGIVSGHWARWARRIGKDATKIGARFTIDGVTNQAVLFNLRDGA